jgi:small subunit ribosomal protein S17
MSVSQIGTVVSDKRDKTITVSVLERKTHPLYRKQYTVTRKYSAHDPKNEAKVGDTVEIHESRPISRTKTWALTKVLARTHEAMELKEEVTATPGEQAETTEEAK